jgi:transglutaminase-like putative cysteine protease
MTESAALEALEEPSRAVAPRIPAVSAAGSWNGLRRSRLGLPGLAVLEGVGDEVVHRLAEVAGLTLLVAHLHGDILEVDQPLAGVLVACHGRRLQLAGQRGEGVTEVFGRGLDLLVALVNGLDVHGSLPSEPRSRWRTPPRVRCPTLRSPAGARRAETPPAWHHPPMGSRRMMVGCQFTYQAAIATPAIFQVRPTEPALGARRSEAWSSVPEMSLHGYTDLYGNPCTRVLLPAGRSTLGYEADFEVADATEACDDTAPEIRPELLPDDTLLYTLPSRYCLPDVLGNEAWSLFGASPPGYGRVRQICDHVHSHLTFRYGSSTPWSTAADVNSTRLGVCRDFTHLAISFCRALNIPARYVFGYLPDMDVPFDPAPMDFAAWMEVWLGERWWTFDPRNNTPRKGRVVIGRGRDASDVAMATTFGGPLLESMNVRAEEIPPSSP